MDRRSVEEAIASCTACHLAGPQVAPVPFRGPTPAAAAIIAEAPGKVENLWGKPLIGPAGQLLNRSLADLGLDLDRVLYANVVSCFPDGAPTPESIVACHDHFEGQLGLSEAPVVLLLGNYALQAFRPGAKIMANRGTWFTYEDRWMLPTFHPSAILRNEEWKDMWMDDLKSFVERVNGT